MDLPSQALVDCVATGRDPTVQELFDVAERIWSEVGQVRSAVAPAGLPSESEGRAQAIRLALVALRGS